MNYIEKYNKIISTTEEHITETPQEINDRLQDILIMNGRAINDVFNFITDVTFAKYVRKRRLERVFSYKVSNGYSWEEAAFEFGIPDQPTFSRSFKAEFGCSPSEAELDPTIAGFIQPLYMGESMDTAQIETVFSSVKPERKMMTSSLGLEQYHVFEMIQEHQTMYGFSDEEILDLYNMSKEHDIALDQLCECRVFEKDEEYNLCDDWLISYYSVSRALIDKEHVLDLEDVKFAKLVAERYEISFYEAYTKLRCDYDELVFFLIYRCGAEDQEAFEFRAMLERQDLDYRKMDAEYFYIYFDQNDPLFSYKDYEKIKEVCGDVYDIFDELKLMKTDDQTWEEVAIAHGPGSWDDDIMDDLNNAYQELQQLQQQDDIELFLDERDEINRDDWFY